MQFYVIYLKELKEQFHVSPCIIQLVKPDMGFKKAINSNAILFRESNQYSNQIKLLKM